MTDFYGQIFRHVLFPAYEGGLRRRKTLRYLREYKQSQWLPAERIEALQWCKLQRLIRHCWDQVPYYRELWPKLGINGPDDITGPADYARLPALNKPEIRENFDKLIARDHRKSLLYKVTGGSTGEPFRFGYTRESYERRLSIMWRGYGWLGAQLGQRTIYLWGSSLGAQKYKDRIYHAAFNRIMLNVYEMNDDRLAEFADAIDRYKPETIVAYVLPLVHLAEWLVANGRRIHRPDRIIGAAEALHEDQRHVLEQAFGCPAYNTYGCREFMLIASECEHRSGLHVNADHLRVELGAPADGAHDDGPRDVIVTDLHNYGMPLLRYSNGDLATYSSSSCACGRELPMLASVDGRKLDALLTPDRRYIPGQYINHCFFNTTGIKRYQVVQKKLDAFEILVVRDDGFDGTAVDTARRELMNLVGESVALDFKFVDDIPLTPSGKFRVTISELP